MKLEFFFAAVRTAYWSACVWVCRCPDLCSVEIPKNKNVGADAISFSLNSADVCVTDRRLSESLPLHRMLAGGSGLYDAGTGTSPTKKKVMARGRTAFAWRGVHCEGYEQTPACFPQESFAF